MHLTESLRNPHPDVLNTLLTHCTRIKVVRLARQFADELGLPWAKSSTRIASAWAVIAAGRCAPAAMNS